MSARFDVRPTAIGGAIVLERRPIGDSRGLLERMFCRGELQPIVGDRVVEQINRTVTARRGAVRGLHFQRPPAAEMKFVSCLHGEVFDVVVDLRRGSPTFLAWHGEILSERNHRTLVVPEGCAHGFQTLSDDCHLLYLHTAPYAPQHEGGANAVDPRLAIAWPLPIGERSARDEAHPMIDDWFEGLDA